jgi:hypothetical protein
MRSAGFFAIVLHAAEVDACLAKSVGVREPLLLERRGVKLDVQRHLFVHLRIPDSRVEARGESAKPAGHCLS